MSLRLQGSNCRRPPVCPVPSTSIHRGSDGSNVTRPRSSACPRGSRTSPSNSGGGGGGGGGGVGGPLPPTPNPAAWSQRHRTYVLSIHLLSKSGQDPIATSTQGFFLK